MFKYRILALLLLASNLCVGLAQNTVESIRKRYADAKEYVRTHTGSNLDDGGDFGCYYHVEARQWLPGTGGHIENTYLYYDEDYVADSVIYKPHFLVFATKRFNYAAREYYQEFLYDHDGKIAFVYAYDPMISFDGDENDLQYEFRLYFSKGRLIKSIIKSKNYDEKEFKQVYSGTTIPAKYKSSYNELLSASKSIRQLFLDVDKEAY